MISRRRNTRQFGPAHTSIHDPDVNLLKPTVQKTDVEKKGPTETFTGRVDFNGKYRSRHMDEGRQKFERIFSYSSERVKANHMASAGHRACVGSVARETIISWTAPQNKG